MRRGEEIARTLRVTDGEKKKRGNLSRDPQASLDMPEGRGGFPPGKKKD